jgi:hypothetical protein
MAAEIAIAPSFVAGTSFKLPPKLPMGVLTAATMYTSFEAIKIQI